MTKKNNLKKGAMKTIKKEIARYKKLAEQEDTKAKREEKLVKELINAVIRLTKVLEKLTKW